MSNHVVYDTFEIASNKKQHNLFYMIERINLHTTAATINILSIIWKSSAWNFRRVMLISVINTNYEIVVLISNGK